MEYPPYAGICSKSITQIVLWGRTISTVTVCWLQSNDRLSISVADIDTVKILAEEESGKTRRTYNYRVNSVTSHYQIHPNPSIALAIPVYIFCDFYTAFFIYLEPLIMPTCLLSISMLKWVFPSEFSYIFISLHFDFIYSVWIQISLYREIATFTKCYLHRWLINFLKVSLIFTLALAVRCFY